MVAGQLERQRDPEVARPGVLGTGEQNRPRPFEALRPLRTDSVEVDHRPAAWVTNGDRLVQSDLRFPAYACRQRTKQRRRRAAHARLPDHGRPERALAVADHGPPLGGLDYEELPA